MFPFPTFCPADGGGPSTLTAGTYAIGIGHVSSAFRTVAGDPGPDVGSLTPSPTAATWYALLTGETLIEGEPENGLLIYLAGDQTGHFSGKTLTVGSNTYTAPELAGEFYSSEASITSFVWLAKEMLIDGNSYSVTVT